MYYQMQIKQTAGSETGTGQVSTAKKYFSTPD
jgi:hypothetical protein